MDHAYQQHLIFYVNGVKVVEENAQPEWTLLFYLRNKLRLTGTKLGCGEGGCGACTVMVSRYDRQQNRILHYSVNSCLAPVCSLHGLAITTVEGLGDWDDSGKRRLHSVQERLGRSHASQCGFCTPGFVMSMYSLLRNEGKPTMDQVEEAFQGNLCRCTGYRPILEGCRTFTKDYQGCCGGQGSGNCCMMLKDHQEESNIATSLTPNDFAAYDSSQEPIFPPELQLSSKLDDSFLRIQGSRVTWYRPVNMEQLLQLKFQHPEARLIVGNTELGLESKKGDKIPILIHPLMVPELLEIRVEDDGIVFGGCVSLDNIERTLKDQIEKLAEEETRIYRAIVRMLHWFGSKQIRNVASIAGNILTASPVSDLIPIFVACGVILELQSSRGTRRVIMDDHFCTGYRKTSILQDEILVSVKIPLSSVDQFVLAYKQSRRRTDDISIVNAAFRLVLDRESCRIVDIKLVFGGMAPTAVTAHRTREALLGSSWEKSILDKAFQTLLEDFTLDPSSPGGMPRYRLSLCLSFFCKFFGDVSSALDGPAAMEADEKLAKRSSQWYEISAEDRDPIGVPVPHSSALKHATGEAVYCDDIPRIAGELYMALVMSQRSHARILSIDPSEALSLRGVHSFFSAKDLQQSRNVRGKVIQDEEVFASDKVTCFGQILGCIIAEDKDLAQQAARLVCVQYEDIQPVILTIDDAIHRRSFYEGHSRSMRCGDAEQALRDSEKTLEGVFHIAGQEHFYLETNAVLAVPKNEDGEMEIFCSTQDLTGLQLEAAQLLGVPANRITCRCKRVGGAFGGKQTRPSLVALPAVFAAAKLRRPIRCMLDRDEDMILTGMRNPVKAHYNVGFNQEGRVSALKMEMYFNGGNSLDVSGAVIERSLLHLENAYKIPNIDVTAHVCRTNLPSNTAFRGFGAPQSMLTCENWINDIAITLGQDPSVVRGLNLYSEGDTTPFGQTIDYCTLKRCWNECISQSYYLERRRQVDAFNEENRYKKKGLAIVPTKYGIGFSISSMNQAGALVHVYKDGSVLLSHGGIEMGQGLHIKMIQVASKTLGIPYTDIFTSETATDKIANTSPTAASFSSDLYGMAVLKACTAIMERLEPIRVSLPDSTWEEWIKEAYLRQISLTATGFHSLPELGYNFKTGEGRPYNYFTFGAACSEVEIDCLTGDHRVLRSDIVMDVGESLNPAIDIGQIEGAFVQGMGMFTLEEPMFGSDGFLRTQGPSNYKIPTSDDIPVEFNVSILRGSPNPRAVFSSKAVGEPPFFLSSSIFFAIKDAVSAARRDVGLEAIFTMDSPCTAERIRLACADEITQSVPEYTSGTYQPWTVTI